MEKEIDYRVLSLRQLWEAFCVLNEFNEPKDIKAFFKKTRKRDVAEKRQLWWYLCKNFTKASYAKIGSFGKDEFDLGRWDHASVLHGVKVIQNLIDADKKFKPYYELIEKKLKHKTKAYMVENELDGYWESPYFEKNNVNVA